MTTLVRRRDDHWMRKQEGILLARNSGARGDAPSRRAGTAGLGQRVGVEQAYRVEYICRGERVDGERERER